MRDKNVKNTGGFWKQHTHKSELEIVNSKLSKIQKSENVSLEEQNIRENSFNAISDWIVLSDLNSRIVRTNNAGEKFTGLSCSEMIGKSCCELIHNSTKRLLKCPTSEMFETGQRASSKLQLPEGKWISVTIEPVKDKENNLRAAVNIIRDITQLKNDEKNKRFRRKVQKHF